MKFIKLVGLIGMIFFTFFYIDKTITTLKEEDSIMIDIKKYASNYKKNYTDGIIYNNTFKVGLNGYEINLDKSYKSMKKENVYNPNLFVYNKLVPSISLSDNMNKFLVGSVKEKYLSIIYILSNDKYLNKLINTNITINFFVDYNYLVTNTTKINNISNHSFYSYGDNGTYTQDNLLFSSNLIKRLKKNETNFCLTTNYSDEVLNICQNNNFYTINPSIICSSDCYTKLTKKVLNGSIILIKDSNIEELDKIITYIQKNDYKIVNLSELLSE